MSGTQAGLVTRVGKGNPKVRVWEEVYQVYREVAKEYGIALADLVSIVLMYTPVLAPYVIAIGIEDNFDVDRETAMEIAGELESRMKESIRRYYGEEGEANA